MTWRRGRDIWKEAAGKTEVVQWLGVLCWEPRGAAGLHTLHASSGERHFFSCAGEQLRQTPPPISGHRLAVPTDRSRRAAGKASHISLLIQERALLSAVKVQLLCKQHGQRHCFYLAVPPKDTPCVPVALWRSCSCPSWGAQLSVNSVIPKEMSLILSFPTSPGVHCCHAMQLGACSSPQFCWLPLGDASLEPSLLHVLTICMLSRGGLWQAPNAVDWVH